MELDFEEFEGGEPVDTRANIHVTINSKGKLFFNGRALDALGLPDGVVLMYDRRRSIIGVKPSPLNRKNAYRLRHKERARTRGQMISARNFCRNYSILPTETFAFTAAEVKDGILILDLNEVRSVKKA